VTIREIDAEHSKFCYSADFEPTEGTGEAEARAAVQAFAQDCAKGIARVLSRPDFR